MLGEARYYWRMARGIQQLSRTPPPSDPEGLIRNQLDNREGIFLDTLRRVVFAERDHPYHQMFRLAGCGYEDLAEAVARDGLEGALAVILRQGVHLTHDEFKGKTAIVRSGTHIPAAEGSFANPLASGLIEVASGGSRSKGTRTRSSTAHLIHKEAYHLLAMREFGLGEYCHLQLKPILPSSGIMACIRHGRLGCPVERWFATGGTLGDSAHYRMLTGALVAVSRLSGMKAPWPTYLPADDFSPVAAWIARRGREGRRCAVGAYVSPAARVAAAAINRGLDIRGTLFMVAGEPLTEAKRRQIQAAGAQVFPRYAISEIGPIGYACRQMTAGNCVHLFRDSVAVISQRRRAPLTEQEVESLHFTTLLPYAPYVLINVEMDDSGVVERAGCDCTFASVGFTQRLSQISSYGKLTGAGVTLVGTDVVRILEEVLPARFGGAPGDYQLVEEEGTAQTRLRLRVSPRVGADSLEQIKGCFWNEIRKCYGGSLAARTWRHAEALEVIRGEPFVTSGGKVLPLHLLGGRSQTRYGS